LTPRRGGRYQQGCGKFGLFRAGVGHQESISHVGHSRGQHEHVRRRMGADFWWRWSPRRGQARENDGQEARQEGGRHEAGDEEGRHAEGDHEARCHEASQAPRPLRLGRVTTALPSPPRCFPVELAPISDPPPPTFAPGLVRESKSGAKVSGPGPHCRSRHPADARSAVGNLGSEANSRHCCRPACGCRTPHKYRMPRSSGCSLLRQGCLMLGKCH